MKYKKMATKICCDIGKLSPDQQLHVISKINKTFDLSKIMMRLQK